MAVKWYTKKQGHSIIIAQYGFIGPKRMQIGLFDDNGGIKSLFYKYEEKKCTRQIYRIARKTPSF